MTGRHGEHDLVAEERLEYDSAMPARRADDAELELTPRHLLDDALRVRHLKGDGHVWVEPLELGEHHWHDRAARPGRGSELEAAGQFALGLFAELREELLLHREQP